LLVSTFCISPLAAQTGAVRGVVQDSSGAVIPAAVVHLTEDTFQASSTADDHGVFSFAAVPTRSGTIEVAKKGFQTLRKPILVGISAQDLVLTLEPASSGEQVVVSATRTDMRLSDSPGSTVLLSSVDITATPALRVDDVLRQVPGFSLFRRSSSRTANASAQGVSLRGLGGSASSRALVLADGIPLVDPFGGWVYWSRVPRVALSSIEVFRGGDSNLYGSSALGGVVQLITRETESPAIVLETSYGNERTPSFSLWAGGATGKWDYSTSTEMFRTDGFILVPDSVRGTVDTQANSEDATVYARIGHALGNDGRVFLRGNFYTEFRNNGTPLQINDTRIGEAAAGMDKQFGDDSLTLRLYGDVEGYNQRFSAIAGDRNSETLTDIQHVPEQVVGGVAQWTHVMHKRQTLIAGLDLNEVIGASEEQLFTGANRQRDGGGRQRTFGFFGADIFRLANWTFLLAARVDDWSNLNGSLTITPSSGPPAVTRYPDRQDVALSPRLSMLHSLNQRLSVTASLYRAFRAPTLNELYRTFRVGNVLTSNNAALNAERLTGAEAGLNFSGWQDRASLRGTFFWSDIVNPVANVTISSTPSLITRKKENLGRTRSRGVEIDGIVRVNRDIQISAGYAYTDATVVSYPGNPGGVNLEGLEIPQVPRNVFTWEARYWNPQRFMLSVSGRFVGQQFDDDQNQLPLNRFYTMDATLGRSLTHHLDLYASAENIFDQRYQVARTPVVNLGPPVLFRVGLRLSYPANKR
jgi:outer membrane cobalamin receptor